VVKATRGDGAMGRRGEGDRMRRGRRVAKATQDGGGRGLERRERSADEKEKKEKTHQASAASRHAFMSGKGAAS
jgi:hypothetical protein